MEMVRVAVPEVVLVMLTGLVEPKLSVGGSTAPVGLVAMSAVSATLPVKPLAGVTVTLDVFPVVAPGVETVTAVPLTVKLGATVAAYVKVSLLLAPPGVVTVNLTAPLPAGEIAVICVEEFTVKLVAAVLPKLTAVAPLRLVPDRVTEVPPAAGPPAGLIAVSEGAAGAPAVMVMVAKLLFQ